MSSKDNGSSPTGVLILQIGVDVNPNLNGATLISGRFFTAFSKMLFTSFSWDFFLP